MDHQWRSSSIMEELNHRLTKAEPEEQGSQLKPVGYWFQLATLFLWLRLEYSMIQLLQRCLILPSLCSTFVLSRISSAVVFRVPASASVTPPWLSGPFTLGFTSISSGSIGPLVSSGSLDLYVGFFFYIDFFLYRFVYIDHLL